MVPGVSNSDSSTGFSLHRSARYEPPVELSIAASGNRVVLHRSAVYVIPGAVFVRGQSRPTLFDDAKKVSRSL